MMRKNPTSRLASAVMAASLALGCAGTTAGLSIERSEKADPKPQQGPAFDPENYKIMADTSYSPVIEYGDADSFDPAPSYGDTMQLADALTLLLPDGWKGLRNDDTQAAMTVSWDISSGTWVDVLDNLGARHGLQFHIDHTNNRVYIRSGRKLLVEPESEIDSTGRFASQSASQNSNSAKQPKADHEPKIRKPSEPLNEDTITFDINGGDDGERVMNDLAMLMGYDRLYWMTEPKVFHSSEVVKGRGARIIEQLSQKLQVKSCVYDGNSNVIAVISKKTECPQ